MKKFILFFAAILISGIGLAQTTVTGTVVDSEVGTGLPGATIVVKGTSDGVSSDFNGSFSISVDSGATLVVSYVGYESQEVVVGESANVGIIQLQPGDNILSGVTVFGSVFLAKDRQTPVAVSTLTTSEIEERIGNLELPELLNSTPGVFATGGGGAFGDCPADPRHSAGRDSGPEALRLPGHRDLAQPHLQRLHYHEPGLRRPHRAAGERQGPLPVGGDDRAGLRDDLRDHALLRGLRGGPCDGTEVHDALPAQQGPPLGPSALRLGLTGRQVHPRDRRKPQAGGS